MAIIVAVVSVITCVDQDDVWDEEGKKDSESSKLKVVSVGLQGNKPSQPLLYNEKDEISPTYHFKGDTSGAEDYDENQRLQDKIVETEKPESESPSSSLEESEYYQDPLFDPNKLYNNHKYGA